MYFYFRFFIFNIIICLFLTINFVSASQISNKDFSESLPKRKSRIKEKSITDKIIDQIKFENLLNDFDLLSILQDVTKREYIGRIVYINENMNVIVISGDFENVLKVEDSVYIILDKQIIALRIKFLNYTSAGCSFENELLWPVLVKNYNKKQSLYVFIEKKVTIISPQESSEFDKEKVDSFIYTYSYETKRDRNIIVRHYFRNHWVAHSIMFSYANPILQNSNFSNTVSGLGSSSGLQYRKFGLTILKQFPFPYIIFDLRFYLSNYYIKNLLKTNDAQNVSFGGEFSLLGLYPLNKYVSFESGLAINTFNFNNFSFKTGFNVSTNNFLSISMVFNISLSFSLINKNHYFSLSVGNFY